MASPVSKTLLLFAAVLAVFVVIGGLVGEYVFGSWLAGLIVALGLSLVLNVVAYFASDRIVLWSTRARIVSAAEAPRLARAVSELAPAFGLLAPRLAVVPTPTPNAFATGRDERHAVVAATEGLLKLLDDRELRGVLAHELAHIRDRDVLVMTIAATLAGAISFAAQTLIFSSMLGGGRGRGVNPLVLVVAAVTAPIAAMLLRLAISRTREYRADEVGARTTGDPGSLASALGKLESGNARRPLTVGSPAQASLYIVNPLRGGGLAGLFSTHPPIAERIRRLRQMRPDPTYRPPWRPVTVGSTRPLRG
jgi:heat shock protein HtpX